MSGAPMLKAAGLWEHTSAAGNRYLVGRWGGVKVLILENRDRQNDHEPSHHLVIAEAPERPRAAAPDERSGPAVASEPRARNARRRPPYARQHAAVPDGPPLPDDEIPL